MIVQRNKMLRNFCFVEFKIFRIFNLNFVNYRLGGSDFLFSNKENSDNKHTNPK